MTSASTTGRHSADRRAPRARRSLTRWTALLAVPALALATVAVVGVQHAPVASAASATPWLPFDKGSLPTNTKLVFAHYLPSLTISMDNKPPASDYWQVNYMNPSGEGGAHVAYGGFTRDRPLGRAPLGSNWRLLDMQTEVQQAMSAGIDGFAVDLLTTNTSAQIYQSVVTLLQAAHNVSPTFKIMLQIDTSALSGSSAASLAAMTKALGAYPAAFRDSQGHLVVSPFYAEVHSASWWSSYLSIMSSTYGESVAFFPVLLDDLNYRASFAPISVGLGSWGSRTASWNPPTVTYPTGPLGRISTVHSMGKLWMQAVAVQDSRPNQRTYFEPENTLTMRETWQIARNGGADWVLLPTWNDYTENSEIAPSLHHGYTYLDLMSYYISWFKTGVQPSIVRDAVYVTHRNEPTSAKPSFPQSMLMTPSAGTTPTNNVESLNFLTAPATVSVSVGGVITTCNAPAGVSTCIAPLRAGAVKVAVVRSGGLVAAVDSPWTVTNTPYVQDFQYVGVSSLRGAGGTTVTSSGGPVSTTSALSRVSSAVTNQTPTVFRVSLAPWYATGTVALKLDSGTVATAPVINSVATLTLPKGQTPGSHTVTASYSPNDASAFVASSSGSLPITVINAANVAPIFADAAHLAGGVRVGSIARCAATITTTTSAGYQWYVDGKRIKHASKYTYAPGVGLLGHRLSCKVTATNTHGTTASTALARKVTVGSAPRALTRPAYTTSVRAGRVVTVTGGRWTPKKVAVSYVWRVNGHIVAKTAKGSLKLRSSYRYGTLTVEARAAKAGYRTGSSRTVAATIR